VRHAHHAAAAHPHQRQHGTQSIGPDVHDAHFGLRGAVRRFDRRREAHPFLQQIQVAFRGRNRRHLLAGRIEHDAAAGEREERLQHELIRGQRQRGDRVEAPRARHHRVGQPRNRRLAQAEVPGRMADPLHVEIVTVVERHRMSGAFELVGDDAVVDAANRHLAPADAAQQLPAAHHDLAGVDRGDAPQPFGEREVGTRLLRFRRKLHQHDLGRVVRTNEHVAHQGEVAGRRQPVEVRAECGRQVVHLAIGLGQRVLEGVERREGLQFDEPRLQRALGGAHDPEVDLHAGGTRLLAGAQIPRRDQRLGVGAGLGVIEERGDQRGAGRCHLPEQGLGEEARRLRHGELQRHPGLRAERREQRCVPLRRPLRVERGPQGGHHARVSSFRPRPGRRRAA